MPLQTDAERHDGHLVVTTFPDRERLGAAAALEIATALRASLQRQNRVRMIFASAPSQAETLSALAVAPGIDWRRVTAFHMDEYIGLPAEAPQRFGNWLKSHLFDHIDIGEAHILDPRGDPESEAEAYAGLLDRGAIDFVCLGIGVNGHIAFNDPPLADFNDPLSVRIVTLDEVSRRQQVDDKCFTQLSDVPHRAITLTIPALMRARRLFCVVPGARKRDAVRAALTGPVSTACPASILRTHPDCTIYLDPESDPDG
jgi:glucosamine-6-phosphate deaminase